MIRRILPALLLVAICCTGSAAPDLKQLQEQARKQRLQHAFPHLKKLAGEHKMEDLCAMKLDRGKLVLEPKFTGQVQPQGALVTVEGMSEPVQLYVYRAGDRIMNFRIATMDFSDKEAVAIDTQVQWTTGQLTIHRSWQLPNSYRHISLTQYDPSMAAGMGMPPGTGIMLNVNAAGSRGEPQNLNLRARDFTDLRRKHWKEINFYLRPLLRDLRLESALAADPLAAWQVFAEEWSPPPALVEKVNRLLPDLDADAFAQREAAAQKLIALGQDVALVILRMDRSQLSMEQNGKLDMVMARYQIVPSAEATRLKDDPHFLLDCLYLDEEKVLAAATQRLARFMNRPVTIDRTLKQDQRIAYIEAMRNELLGGKATTQKGQG